MNLEQLESRQLLSAGDPDASFGVGGQVEYVTPLESVNDAIDIAILPDGKFLQGGSIRPPGQSREHRYFLRRLNADGTLDATFGAGGTVVGTFPVDFVSRTIGQMAVAPDGKIYMAGTSSLGIVRFHADGSLDTTFGGGDGVVETHRDAPVELAIQPDGKLLFLDGIGGVKRYLPDGTLDPSFGGGDGEVDAPLTANNLAASYVVRALPDGKLLLGGRAGASSKFFRSALARLNADGSLDTTFGDGGRVLDAIPGSGPEDNKITDIVLLPGGKFLACGETREDDAEAAGGFVLARYNANGTLDTSYGRGGVATIQLGEVDLARVLLDTDGNAVAFGQGGGGIVVARVTPQGQLDQTLGRVYAAGFNDPDVQSFAFAQAAVLQPDGKLLLVGARQLWASTGKATTTFITRLHMSDDGVASPVSLDAASRVMSIVGTPGRDLLLASETGEVVYGVRRGFGRVFDAADIARIDVLAREGDDYVIGSGLSTVPLNVLGGLGSDKIAGGAANDTLEGSGGNDFIDGNDGDDLLLGGNGDDALRGLAGHDTLAGGPGNDFEVDIHLPDASYDAKGLLKFSDTGNDDDQVSIWDDGAGGLVVWVDGVTDTIPIAAVREISLSGMGGNDLLKLNPGITLPSTLAGGAGNDTLIGGANRDEIFGGAGDDALRGNASFDHLQGDDGNDTLIGGAGGDALFGAGGNDRLDGGDGNDYVEGGAGHDVLAGGSGADTIYGLAGNDVLLARDAAKDTVDGGDGFDEAELDPLDDVALIESAI